VGVRHTETNLIIWAQAAPAAGAQRVDATASAAETAAPAFNADRLYDAGDKGCAAGPMDEIAAIMRKLQAGQTLEIRATDPSVAFDLAAWCRMTGNELVDQRNDRYLVKKKP